MVNGIDIEHVKSYNTQLKNYKEQASKITAQIEYSTKDLTNLCNELSVELGKTVTPDNIEDIYNEFMTSIKNTLDTGNAILAQIASDTASQQTQVQQSVPNLQTQQVIGQEQYANMNVQQVASQPASQSVFNNTVGQSSFFPNGMSTAGQHIVSL